MNILKISIFSACIIGIISSIVDIATPSISLKNQMKLITALILILAVFSPFMGKGFDIDFESLSKFDDNDKYSEMAEDFNESYINLSKEKIEKKLLDILLAENFDVKKVVIDLNLNEYNSLEVKKATVFIHPLSEDERSKITKIIKNCLPDSDVEISEVTSNESN